MEIRIEGSVEKLIASLEKPTIAKVLRTIDLLEKFGHRLGMPHSKKVKKDLFELRIRGKQEIRIFYGFHKKQIILVHAFIKKSQKTPQRELKAALRKMNDLT